MNIDEQWQELTLGQYQEEARKTAIYPDEAKITYPLLGLAGEVGEFCNKYKKVIRDGRELSIEELSGEIGDILWYVAMLAYDCGIDLEYIGAHNLEKLLSRQARGVLGGSGDSR